MEFFAIPIAVVVVLVLLARYRRKHNDQRDEKIYADRLQLRSLIDEAEQMFPGKDLYGSLAKLFDARATSLKQARALGDGPQAQSLRRKLIGDRILLAQEMARLLLAKAERDHTIQVL